MRDESLVMRVDVLSARDYLERALPEDIEWPRFEDGDPVVPGCEFADGLGNARTCTSVEIFGETDGARDALVHWDADDPDDALLVCMAEGGRVKRPAPPKPILGADGEAVRVGDEVYSTAGWGPFTVSAIWDAQPAPPKGVERSPGAERWMAKVDDPDGRLFLVENLVHELPEERCGVCRHFRLAPYSVVRGVCWESFTEREGQEVFLACLSGDRGCCMFDRRQSDEEGER